MARIKYDGVVEAVRYSPEGRVALVRVYERRGPTFSDRILLSREQLLERLNRGGKWVSGQRQPFMGGTFETGPQVQLAGSKDDPLIVTAGSNGSQRDELRDVPVF